MKVLKFGGSSVGNAENIEKVVSIVRESSAANRCAVVLSAMQGTTDALINVGQHAASGDESFRNEIKSIEQKHLETLRALIPNDAQKDVVNFIGERVGEIENICEGVFLLGELSARTLDRIVSFGEILSTKIVAAKLESLQIENVWKDSRELIFTDSNFGSAAVDFAKTNGLIEEFFNRQIQNPKSKIQNLTILPGFIASDANGATTTLGRGGSDYTAAILAAALDAEVLEIWTDVSGIMTADPRLVRNIKQLERITYREAMELSHFGAKIIYPPTIQPVMAKKIPIVVKNTFAPLEVGTRVEAVGSPGTELEFAL